LIFGEDDEPQTNMEILYDTAESDKIADEELEKKKKIILSSLTEKELELFEMVYIKHLEYEELAKNFNVSEHAMRTRVYRLRLKIKEKASYMFMVLLLLVMKI
ncbi:MAG: sigma-70 family RNA polymerase sigma factor, partial [Clostridia bacterium]|nr:sigma-70 family RNA polymerase sigma factor [Clostridia bacterium]